MIYTSVRTNLKDTYYSILILVRTAVRSSQVARTEVRTVRAKILCTIAYTGCDRAGLAPPANHPQKSLQERQRRTATRKTGCQFSVIAREGIDTQWELRHRPSKPGTEYGIHIHPSSQSISSHPAHRKLAQAEINQARSLHNTGKSNII